ncbi:DUF4355 domain-containing protein [Halobacillus sp. BAB-2008]|uniref:DUF4355 domain-containing protein n=1 Tax=Halobacillus sp. BAB-2008 TaxID=1246484 RepID=UPI0002A4E319|nr:DUF4355 domain-containing protein [Halobacillus sp. BAB-2008]ELK47188.1 phage protein [Halobacillus sp. BAB-2008]
MTELQSKLLRLNLQHFAENDPPQDPPSDPPEDPPEDDPTFTQSDVDSAISKAVDKALKNQAAKLEKEKQQAIDDAKKDAADYAKMTKQQQADADYQKRMKDLEDRERDLNLKQLLSEVEGDLKEEKLPTSFAETLIKLEDNEKIKEAIKGIKKDFDNAVNQAVKESLRQDPPASGQSFKGDQSGQQSKAEMAKKARII